MGKAADIINKCLKERNTSQRKLAENMNTIVQTINQQLKGDDLKVEKFIEMLDYLGYRVSVEDIGDVVRVHPDMFEQKIAENPDGHIWTVKDGKYLAAMMVDGAIQTRTFDGKTECLDYLLGNEEK